MMQTLEAIKPVSMVSIHVLPVNVLLWPPNSYKCSPITPVLGNVHIIFFVSLLSSQETVWHG